MPDTQTCEELVSRVVEEPLASVEKANSQNFCNLNLIGSDEDFESSEEQPMEDNTDPNYQPNSDETYSDDDDWDECAIDLQNNDVGLVNPL